MINKFLFLDDFVVCLYEEIIKLSDCLEYPTRDSMSLCSCYLSRMWRRSWMTHRRLLNINRLLTVVVMLLLYLKASTCNMLGNVKVYHFLHFCPMQLWACKAFWFICWFHRCRNKHYCVLSNSGLSNATSKRPKWAFFRGKICPPQSRNCQNWILHISCYFWFRWYSR